MLVDNGVDLRRRDSGNDHLLNQLMGLPDTDAGLPHQTNFAF
jgi:hypothetical protein